MLNRVVNWGIRVLFRSGYNDTTNAFKAYRREVIETVQPLLSNHFNLTVEIPLKAIVRGHSYAVVPISWRNRKEGESKLSLQEMGSRYAFIVLYVLLERHLSRGDYERLEPGMARASASRRRAFESREANVSLTREHCPRHRLERPGRLRDGRHARRRGLVGPRLDNNMRRDFFGPDGDTTANRDRLLSRPRTSATTSSTSVIGTASAGSSTRCGRASSSTAPRSLLTTSPRDARSTTSR